MGPKAGSLVTYYYVDSEGTRSEVRHYYLSYKGVAIPDTYELVVTVSDGSAFAFSEGGRFKDDGYIPFAARSGDRFEFPDPVGDFSPEDRERGFYPGKTPKAGMPEDWIYVEGGDLRAFIDPSRAGDVALAFKLSALPRFKLIDEGLELEP